jgi:hypothetical protein
LAIDRLTLSRKYEVVGSAHPTKLSMAALFSFSMALATYNILATIRAALGSVHGVGKIEAGLSDFYLVDEIQGTYRGMMIAIPAPYWQVFGTSSDEQMVSMLQQLADEVKLKRFLKATRGIKKKRPPLIVNKHRHVSTARLLETHQTLMKSGVRK